MNVYWEKYKNRNRSQDVTLKKHEEKVPNSVILDHISAMQSQINAIEDRIVDLNCKLSNLNRNEHDMKYKIQPLLDQSGILEKSIEVQNDFDARIGRIERRNAYERFENLEKDVFRAFDKTEQRLSEYLSMEISKIHRKVSEIAGVGREPEKNTARFDDNVLDTNRQMKEVHKWQKKIEKIVLVCAERLKNPEIRGKNENLNNLADHVENIQVEVLKFKKNQTKFSEKLLELEEFSKKICKKVIRFESKEPDLVCKNSTVKKQKTPIKKKEKDPKSEKKSKFYTEKFESKSTKDRNRSISPVSERLSNRQNRLDQMYQNLINS